jgi:sRNA-binding carbon storage regulator CsrA
MVSYGSLVLARKPGQRIFIGTEVCVEVVEGGSVPRLMIRAPKDCKVVRAEIADPGHIDDRIRAMVDRAGWDAVRADPILGPIWAKRMQESKEFVDSIDQ